MYTFIKRTYCLFQLIQQQCSI